MTPASDVKSRYFCIVSPFIASACITLSLCMVLCLAAFFGRAGGASKPAASDCDARHCDLPPPRLDAPSTRGVRDLEV